MDEQTTFKSGDWVVVTQLGYVELGKVFPLTTKAGVTSPGYWHIGTSIFKEHEQFRLATQAEIASVLIPGKWYEAESGYKMEYKALNSAGTLFLSSRYITPKGELVIYDEGKFVTIKCMIETPEIAKTEVEPKPAVVEEPKYARCITAYNADTILTKGRIYNWPNPIGDDGRTKGAFDINVWHWLFEPATVKDYELQQEAERNKAMYPVTPNEVTPPPAKPWKKGDWVRVTVGGVFKVPYHVGELWELTEDLNDLNSISNAAAKREGLSTRLMRSKCEWVGPLAATTKDRDLSYSIPALGSAMDRDAHDIWMSSGSKGLYVGSKGKTLAMEILTQLPGSSLQTTVRIKKKSRNNHLIVANMLK